MLTDEHRGLALELSLTKLVHSHPGNLQIIGMSATIGGLHLHINSALHFPTVCFVLKDRIAHSGSILCTFWLQSVLAVHEAMA